MLSIRPLSRGPRLLRGPHRTEIRVLFVVDDVSGRKPFQWRFSIWVDKPTPGNALMNLRYKDERAVEVRGKGIVALLLPLLNSSLVKNFLRPFSKDKTSDSSVDDTLCRIYQRKPTIQFLAIPCLHRAGLSCDQEKSDISQFQHQYKKLEDWEEIQNLNSIHNNNNNNTPCSSNFRVPVVDVVKPEMVGQLLYGNYQDLPATSSPASSCVTTNLGHSNIFNFSPPPNKITTTNKVVEPKHQHHPDHSSEVRKEKLGDRITALHQLVSPFGKTDTASVLSEGIGYIRFLQAQIQALSSPYMGNVAGSMGHTHQQSVRALLLLHIFQ
ncbi:Transcription factor bHLH68 [Capsicum baccatum]|uniref:Transcription factor bHLH68 n=1 Tax=Capsicum baccatum TaxID=33114 RepID=A0A2G2WQ44_CAPBA|nr:Transcription factor bHLH68 [Capsicum baccatum]